MELEWREARLVGLSDSALQDRGNTRLLPTVWTAFGLLQEAARSAGFDLQIASGFRDFYRQLAIWNAKLRGERPVLDDRDQVVDLHRLSPDESLCCVMRYSALPGASRHHWGTDMDVFDAAVLPPDYKLQLTGAEVAPAGLFGPLHDWLDARIDGGESFGFYRPYGRDRGAVAPERWHLSYAPLATQCQRQITAQLVSRAWDAAAARDAVVSRQDLEPRLGELLQRYVHNVDAPPDVARRYSPQP